MFDKWRIKIGIRCLSEGERFYYDEGIKRMYEENSLYYCIDEDREGDNPRVN